MICSQAISREAVSSALLLVACALGMIQFGFVQNLGVVEQDYESYYGIDTITFDHMYSIGPPDARSPWPGSGPVKEDLMQQKQKKSV